MRLLYTLLTRPVLLGLVAQAIGTALIVWSFQQEPSRMISEGEQPLTVLTVNRPRALWLGWVLMFLGFGLQIGPEFAAVFAALRLTS